MTDTSSADGSSGSVAGAGSPGRARLSSDAVDAVFDLLSNRRRRFVLAHLTQRGEAVVVDDLAAELARKEDTPHAAGRQQIATSLHHTHLPKLADFGLIEYDERSRTAVPADQPPLLEACLSNALEWERP